MEKKLRTVLFTKYLLLWYDKRKADRERSGIMEQLALSRAENRSAIRLFISSTFADMQPERDCFNDILVTKLRALCRDRGVSFFSVDLRWGVTGEDIANARLIPRCLNEVDKCRPFFLGIIGGRYGSQMGSVPEELLAEYPWLAEKTGASYTELEITYHFLKNNTGDNSLFLFKDCEAEGTDTDRQAIDRLKAYIQEMAPGRIRTYRTLEEFQSIILQEFEQWLVEMYGRTDIHLERERLFARENDSHIAKNTDEEQSVYNCILQTSAAVMLYGKGPLGKTAIVNDVSKRFDNRIVVNCQADEANVYWPYVVFSIYKKIAALGILAQDQGTWFRENAEKFSHGQLLSIREEEQLKTAFLQLLAEVTWKNTLLAINDIEYIGGKQNQYLQWLPAEPPKGLHIVCSTNDGDILNSAKIMGWSLVELRPMEQRTAHTVLTQELDKLGKSADDAQALLKSPLAGYPGYLKTSIDVLNAFGSYDTVAALSEQLASAADFTQFYDVVFQQIANRYGVSSANDLHLVLGALHLSALPLSEDGRYYVLHAICQREKMQWSGVSDVLEALRLVGLGGGLSGALGDYVAKTVSQEERESIYKALGQYWYSVSNTPQGTDLSCLTAALRHYADSKQVDAILTILSNVLWVKDLCVYDSDCLRRALAALMFHSDRSVGKLILRWMTELLNLTLEGDAGTADAFKQLYDLYGELGLEKDAKRRDQLYEQAALRKLLREDDIAERLKVDAEWHWAQQMLEKGELQTAFTRLDQRISDPETLPKHRAKYGLFKAELKYRIQFGSAMEDIEAALQLAVKAAELETVLGVYDLKITALNKNREYADAYELAEFVEQWARELGYVGGILAFKQQKIVSLYRREKYDLALAESEAHHDLCMRWGNLKDAAVMKQNIANIYELQGAHDTCIAYTQKCLKDKLMPSKYRVAMLNVQKTAYLNSEKREKNEKAMQVIKQALAEPELTEQQHIMLSLSQASLFLMKGESFHPKALSQMEQAFGILYKNGNSEAISYCLHSVFPILVGTKGGKALWNRWKEKIGDTAQFYQQTTDPADAILNGSFFAAAGDAPIVSQNIKKLTESYHIAVERKNHALAAETAYDLGMVWGQQDPAQGAAYYLRSAESFRLAEIFGREQEAVLSALRLLIRQGEILDSQSYRQALTCLDESAAALVKLWVAAGEALPDPEKQEEALEALRTVVSAGEKNETIVLAVIADLSALITRHLTAADAATLAELAAANGISDTIFVRLFHAALEDEFMLYESIFGEKAVAELKEKDGDLASIIEASSYFTVVGGSDHSKLFDNAENARVQYIVQPKHAARQLKEVYATVSRFPNGRLLCITDFYFHPMTETLKTAVQQYIANVAASAMWNLQLQPNDCVKCMAFVHADHPALLSVAYSEHAKFLMKVMEDLDALAAR